MNQRSFPAERARALLEDPHQSRLWESEDSDANNLLPKGRGMSDLANHWPASSKHKNATNIAENNKTAERALLLSQRLLDSGRPDRAEQICLQSLSLSCDSHLSDGIRIKLMDSLARQGKNDKIYPIFLSISNVNSKPWALYFGILYHVSKKDYGAAIELLKHACTQAILEAKAIDARLPTLACAICLLHQDYKSLLSFAQLVHYVLSINNPRDMTVFKYVTPSLAEIKHAIEGIALFEGTHNAAIISMLLIGPALGKWNLGAYISKFIVSINDCEAFISKSMLNDIGTDNSDNMCIVVLSLMHYLYTPSPFYEPLEVYQMLARYRGRLCEPFSSLLDSLSISLGHGYCYKPSDSISFYLHLSEERMPQLYNKIRSDFASFNLAFYDPSDDGRFTPYALSDLVPVAEINIEHHKLLSQSILRMLRDAKSITSYSSPSRIFLLPWLKPGGADKVSIDWINYCSSLDGDKSLVIFTEDTTSDWEYRLASSIVVLRTADYIGKFSLEDQAYALALLVQYLQPSLVHNINSNLGYIMAEKHAKALASITQLACHIFCNDRDAFGQWDGYGFRHASLIYTYYKYIFSDNFTFLQEQIEALQSFSVLNRHSDQICTHIYVPTHVPVTAWSVESPKHRCFWAGRLDKQKRPDILAEIAKILAHITFDVYGSTLLDGDTGTLQELSQLQNVNMCGKYSSFYDIKANDYDFYLMTSEWEGIPNTLLEAASLGLPIVAPLVGGIHEFLDQSTGFPVNEFSSAIEYCKIIEHLYSNFADACHRGDAARDRILEKHSFHRMREELLNTNYIQIN